MFNDQHSFFNGVFGNNVFSAQNSFNQLFRCYPIEDFESNNNSNRQNIIYGGKIFLPPSALAKLMNLNVSYPMLFKLSKSQNNKVLEAGTSSSQQIETYAGVLEFVAEEGRVYMPTWMMKTLFLQKQDLVRVSTSDLPLGKYVKIQPQSVDFLDISDPKAMLENAFRNFSCLTKGDLITLEYNDDLYEIKVLETKPENSPSISIVNTDLEVDFAPPVGYVSPKPEKKPLVNTKKIEELENSFTKKGVFEGESRKLNGKSFNTKPNQPEKKLIAVPLNKPLGNLFFGYRLIPINNVTTSEEKFLGEGRALNPKRAKPQE